MASERYNQNDHFAPLKRLASGLLIVLLLGLFVLWRIDSPRVERFRAVVVDTFVPNFDWVLTPITAIANLVRDLQSYAMLSQQNQELRRELQQMKSWKEAALQLEQENARLLDLNKLRVDSNLTHVSGIVMADSGSPFRQSVLLNIGKRDGIQDGWAAMDGLGLVGRISGVAAKTSRVLLLTDISSQIPAIIQPSGQHALVIGDNTIAPQVDFVENTELVRPGDRIVTSGDGGILPPDLLIGQLILDPSGRLRVRLAADYERLEFLRVLRDYSVLEINDEGNMVLPVNLNLVPQIEAQNE